METAALPPSRERRVTSLYVHFPFCESKCHYCDFFSLPESHLGAEERARVYDAVESELAMGAACVDAGLKTVFLGGGTPSLVPLERMAGLMARLPVTADTEITIEANPSSISHERARAWRSAGINRVSMGVQALDDERLRWLGRVHSKSRAFAALEALFDAGFTNVSIDYIVGAPGQTAKDISRELEDVVARFPLIRHLSAYLLTLQRSNAKFPALPDEDEQLLHLRTARDALASLGFEQYEISNFARAGFRSRHNENYWLGGSYLGVGPSAHSFFADSATRTKNWASLGRYRAMVESGSFPTEWTERLTPEQQRIEYLMLRLRCRDGIDLEEYRALFGEDLASSRKTQLSLWQEKGYCQLNARLRLAADGFFVSDTIINNII